MSEATNTELVKGRLFLNSRIMGYFYLFTGFALLLFSFASLTKAIALVVIGFGAVNLIFSSSLFNRFHRYLQKRQYKNKHSYSARDLSPHQRKTRADLIRKIRKIRSENINDVIFMIWFNNYHYGYGCSLSLNPAKILGYQYQEQFEKKLPRILGMSSDAMEVSSAPKGRYEQMYKIYFDKYSDISAENRHGLMHKINHDNAW